MNKTFLEKRNMIIQMMEDLNIKAYFKRDEIPEQYPSAHIFLEKKKGITDMGNGSFGDVLHGFKIYLTTNDQTDPDFAIDSLCHNVESKFVKAFHTGFESVEYSPATTDQVTSVMMAEFYVEI